MTAADAAYWLLWADDISETLEPPGDPFSAEARFAMYGDFEGAFRSVFKLPRGHHGLVIVDAAGAIAMRHSGGLQTEAELTQVRTMLGASEPPPGPPVPTFSEQGVSDRSCAQAPCVLLFLGHDVALTDVPWIDGGFEGDQRARWSQASKPAIRNVSVAMGLPLGERAQGLFVGATQGRTFPAGWSTVATAPALREAFSVPADGTVLLVLRDGRVAFRGDGVVPYYELGRISDLLGVEVQRDD